MATRILYVITKANFGGAQRYVFDLAVAAKQVGHEVAVVVGGTGTLTEKLATAGIRTIPLPLSQHRTFIGDLLTFGPLFSLMRIFRTERPDVVHVNSAKAGGLGSLAARISRVPLIIFTAHGWEFNAPRNVLSKIGIRLFSWVTILLSHKTICVSTAVRRDVAWMPGTKRKLIVVHNGVACGLLLPRDEARTTLCPDSRATYWIGMLSELHPTKRVDDAIRAFASIAARHPDTGLFIISDGKEREKLKRLIHTLHLEKRVALLGYIQDAPQYLSAFDMFVHSSQSEALALAVLEAGCAALPTVATKVGGIPEIIEDNQSGLLVSPRNPAALALAIETLYTDRVKARRFALALHTRVERDFTKERMITETFALYRRL